MQLSYVEAVFCFLLSAPEVRLPGNFTFAETLQAVKDVRAFGKRTESYTRRAINKLYNNDLVELDDGNSDTYCITKKGRKVIKAEQDKVDAEKKARPGLRHSPRKSRMARVTAQQSPKDIYYKGRRCRINHIVHDDVIIRRYKQERQCQGQQLDIDSDDENGHVMEEEDVIPAPVPVTPRRQHQREHLPLVYGHHSCSDTDSDTSYPLSSFSKSPDTMAFSPSISSPATPGPFTPGPIAGPSRTPHVAVFEPRQPADSRSFISPAFSRSLGPNTTLFNSHTSLTGALIVDKKDAELDNTRLQVANLEHTLSTTEDELASIRKILTAKEGEITYFRETLEGKGNELIAARRGLSEATEALVVQRQSELQARQTWTALALGLYASLGNVRGENAALHADLEERRMHVERLEYEVSAARVALERCQAAKVQLEKENTRLREELEEARVKIELLEEELEKMRAERDEAHVDRDTAYAERDVTLSRARALKRRSIQLVRDNSQLTQEGIDAMEL